MERYREIDKEEFFADTHSDRTIITRLIDKINELIVAVNELQATIEDGEKRRLPLARKVEVGKYETSATDDPIDRLILRRHV